MLLKRTAIRRRLMAVLSSTEIPQGLDDEGACVTGPIWENCPASDGNAEPIVVADTSTHQTAADLEAEYQNASETAYINFKVPDVTYRILPKKVDNSRIRFMIEIAAFDADGHKRQNILDTIEARILYRMFSQVEIIDAQTNEKLKPILTMAKMNTVSLEASDDGSPLQDYHIRELTFTLDTNECMPDLNCDLKALCFDFSSLTRLTKDDQND